MFRSAIYRALEKNEVLNHSNIATEVVNALNLPPEEYAQNPGDIGVQPRRNREAFTEYIEYRIFQDLKRGWRVIQPNLEQCGLLKIDYEGLREVCSDEKLWKDNQILSSASADERYKVTKAFLDHLRRSLAIDARCLMGEYHETLKRKVNSTLKEPWNFDDDEILLESKWFAWGERRSKDLSLSPISVIGKYLSSPQTWSGLKSILDISEYEQLLQTLVVILNRAGYLNKETDKENNFRIQLRTDSILWMKGDGEFQEYDIVRYRRFSDTDISQIQQRANPFFVRFYKEGASKLAHFEGREHTGQTDQEEREEREKRFREGGLSCLFCSPTMELGIDISDLSVINMRNVPPTPTNYAQRSGRAGRSGQPAFIITYCSTGSGHDQYFFRQRASMVAGVVVPPRLDLTNEDLIKSHVHSIWLAIVGLDLKHSIADIIDLTKEDLPLLDNIKHHINFSENRIRQCIEECRAVLKQCEKDLMKAEWFSDEWIEATVRSSARDFDEAFNRWRELYRITYNQMMEAQEKLRNAHMNRLTREEQQKIERQEREARYQIDLLCNRTDRDDSDFYPYRYLASEGFLPGYNFPRLPVRAFIPQGGEKGKFIARPRFLAISEFGPRNILYDEGRKYRVIKSLLPVGTPESRFIQAKICKACGAFHTGDNLWVDICEECKTQLNADNSEYLPNLFEMTTVSTWRVERITCDEDERIRTGYIITSHFKFSKKDGKINKILAEIIDKNGKTLLKLTYGPSANLWRINRKWRKSHSEGFTLELTNGIWGKKLGDYADTALDAGEENIRTGVQIFVRDTKNILLIQPAPENPLSEEELTNLQHALHKGLCLAFQIDESEIDSERMGKANHRAILFWEAAEGGVGVLQRLLEEPDVISNIARKALEICHFENDVDTECVRACYDCLMTYKNQRDHKILNRHLIKDMLINLSKSKTIKTYSQRTYDEHYEWLRQQIDSRSQLEKDFLDHLYRKGLRLPDYAQKTLPNYFARPDFYYEDGYVCVFCDGSVHDEPEQKKEDNRIRNDLRNLGYRIVVIRYDRSITDQVQEHKDIFRKVK